jgi:glutamyl/glutaminyl-tRNA synthetase
MGGQPFYRYAGIIDDLLRYATHLPESLADSAPITFVVRDNKQRDLTRVQSHIRAALEHARQKLADNVEAHNTFRDIGIDYRRPLPVPVYIHLPLVVDDTGNKLSKSAPQRSYLIGSLLQQGVLSEAIVAYLIWTLLSRPRTGRQSLDEIAQFTGRYGVECAIARFADELDPSFITQACEQPIKCDLHLLHKANVKAIRSMLPWGFRSRLLDSLRQNEIAESVPASWQLFQQREAFADWNQVISVAQGPRKEHTIDSTTRQFCRTHMNREHAAVMAVIREGVEVARSDIKANRHLAAPSASSLKGAAFLRDLRLILTGAKHSPPVQALLKMLESTTIISRLRKAEQWKVS